jgi:hypothetical protein
VNGNGYVSLAEITKVTALSKKQTSLAHCRRKLIKYKIKGVRDVIAVSDLMDAVPAINRAFHHARKISKVN